MVEIKNDSKLIEHLKEVPANDTLGELRQKAFLRLKEIGFPGRRNEEYKYSNLTRSIEEQIGADSAKKSGEESRPTSGAAPFDTNGFQLAVFVNGRFNPELSTLDDEQGIKISPISSVAAQDDPVFKRHIDVVLPVKEDSFALLNKALASEGLFVHVGKGANAEKPLVIVYGQDNQEELNLNRNVRNLIVMESGSELDVYEIFENTNKSIPGYLNTLTEFIVRENAHGYLARIGDEGDHSVRVSTTLVDQHDHSVFTSVAMDFSGKMVRNNVNINQDGSGCDSHMYGLYLLGGDSHVDNHTTIDHKKPNSESNELYKGILDDRSRGVFNGKIYVRRLAQKTNAFQQNSNILLSDEAVINTKPQLEIWADDVKCSHGCTTGQLDEEQVFYLRTRGLGQKEARSMLLHAYAGEVLTKIRSKTIRDYLELKIESYLD